MSTHVIPRFSDTLRPWVTRQARRTIKLVWWTLTLQIHRRAREWLDARRARRYAPIADDIAPTLIHAVDPAQLRIRRDPDPTVSIIIPTYGKVDYTLGCLASIAACPPHASIEVIVIDDATPDGSTACLADVLGIRLIVNRRNLGYLRACNMAARVASGNFLLFLNNDTQVREGWLDALLSPFLVRNDVGAVGAKLLYPDGTLQEAGCIIWSDGSGWNYGRLDDPNRSIYNYVREVDYCSAACLMVPRALFQRLGGFDERYVPAYCEDSDLAFRLRGAGYKVLYQPRSEVVHFEGISHGKTLTGCLKSCQTRNERKFLERWQTVLSTEHWPNGQHIMSARDRAIGREVVLIIDHYVPEPDRDAGSRTMLCIIRCLLNAGFVVKFWPHNQYYNTRYTPALLELGVEVTYGGDSNAFRIWLDENGEDVNYALLSRPHVAMDFLPYLRRHERIGLLYYGHDLHFARMRREVGLTGDLGLARQADAMETLERSIWRQVGVVLYPSDQETAAVMAKEPAVAAHTLVPYWFGEFAAPRAPIAERAMLFVGGFAHQPNRDGVLWFVDHVLPLIRTWVPDARLVVVGSNPPAEVLALAGETVSVFANVSSEELRLHYRRARVAVVPLRYGAGVKLKVVEALCEGLPLVTTPTGAQGLPGLEQVVAIHDEAQAFADAVCCLLTDGIAWAEKSVAQVDYAALRFSETAFRNSLMVALAQSASRCSARLAS